RAQVQGRLGGEGGAGGQEEVADGPQGVDVGPGVDLLRLVDRFGGHVLRRADHHVVGGQLRRGAADRLDQAEIEHLDEVGDAAAVVEDDVGRLDVAVDQAQAVRLRQGVADLPQDVDD